MMWAMSILCIKISKDTICNITQKQEDPEKEDLYKNTSAKVTILWKVNWKESLKEM